MSNALAIQGVTDCLRTLIRKGIERQQDQGLPELTGLVFTFDPPALIVPQADKLHVNVYLYRLAANSVWTNQTIPTRTRPGERDQPPLALNLHYLVTVVSSTRIFPEQHVLGRVMAAVYEHSVLEAKDYQITNDPADLSLNSLESIRVSGLSDQADRVRFTPVYLALDDLARIFSGADSKLRLSMAYEASPILIESTKPIHGGPPVLFRGRGVLHGEPDGFKVLPFFQAPTLQSARFPFPPAPAPVKPLRALPGGRISDTLLIEGSALPGAPFTLRFRHVATSATRSVTLTPDQVVRGSVLFKIPDESPAWVAGLYTVVALIERRDDFVTVTTNEVSFAIVPAATFTINAPAATTNGDLQIEVKPAVAQGQVVSILFGSVEVPIGVVEDDFAIFDVVFVEDPDVPVVSDAGVKRVAFDARAIPKGDYPVRIRVSGADSLLFDPAATHLNGYLDRCKVHIENGVLTAPTPANGVHVPP